MNKLIAILIVMSFVIASCTTTKEVLSESKQIWWVSGVQTECSTGAGKMNCLNIHKNEDRNNLKWETFYSKIEDFEFEEGYLKKIEVKIEKRKAQDIPADGTAFKYTLVKELEKEVAYQASLNGGWVLAQLNDKPINRSIVLPHLEINLSKKLIAGNGGCNNYSGVIEGLTPNTIQFSKIVSTKKACLNKNIENEYYELLNKVNTYQIKGVNLIFYNKEGQKILSFLKKEAKETNQRLHDIWIAIRINTSPISKMAAIPRLEINLTENKIFGNDGCNDYSGAIEEVSTSQLKFAPIASTKKMCREMETPNAFNKAMNKVTSYKLEGLNLILLDSEGKEVLAFLKGD